MRWYKSRVRAGLSQQDVFAENKIEAGPGVSTEVRRERPRWSIEPLNHTLGQRPLHPKLGANVGGGDRRRVVGDRIPEIRLVTGLTRTRCVRNLYGQGRVVGSDDDDAGR